MMKNIAQLVCFLLVPTFCWSQSDTTGLFKVKTFQDKRYFICEVDARKYRLELFNIADKKNNSHTFHQIDSVRKNELILVVNGGMFMENSRPLGLYISSGTTYRNVNTDTTGYGNFYMQPNGIFVIDTNGAAHVVTTRAYIQGNYRARLATQSGPMLVVNGTFNGHFNKGSSNLNIRNGVGINQKGNVVLVTSLDRVNFYEFAELFRDVLQCPDALYLDGVVSQYYAPSLHEKPLQTLPLGVFITISENKN